MAAIKTGGYRIHFYDKYGTKLKQAKKVKATTIYAAIKKARRYSFIAGYASYCIDRRVYNSLDQKTPY
jgi:type II restriction/modification system DNA methylase subunit YeeA